MDDEGLDPDQLEQALASGDKPAFLYTIPTFQNPSGRTLSTERRRRIADLAREHALPVLEDDPYGLVRFEGEPQPSLFELEGGENVIYSSSFSKTIAPGVRVGWFVLPAGLATQLETRAVDTYISPPFLTQATVYEFVRRGSFEPNVDRVSGLLMARRDAMVTALDEYLPDAPRSRPEGGCFLWLDLPDGVDSAVLSSVRSTRESHLSPAATSSRRAPAARARSASPTALSRRPRSQTGSAGLLPARRRLLRYSCDPTIPASSPIVRLRRITQISETLVVTSTKCTCTCFEFSSMNPTT